MREFEHLGRVNDKNRVFNIGMNNIGRQAKTVRNFSPAEKKESLKQ